MRVDFEQFIFQGILNIGPICAPKGAKIGISFFTVIVFEKNNNIFSLKNAWNYVIESYYVNLNVIF